MKLSIIGLSIGLVLASQPTLADENQFTQALISGNVEPAVEETKRRRAKSDEPELSLPARQFTALRKRRTHILGMSGVLVFCGLREQKWGQRHIVAYNSSFTKDEKTTFAAMTPQEKESVPKAILDEIGIVYDLYLGDGAYRDGSTADRSRCDDISKMPWAVNFPK